MPSIRSHDRRAARVFGAAAAVAALAILVAAPATAASPTLDRIRAAGKITFGYTADARPFSFKDDAGNASGWAVSLCRKVADAVKAELGMSSLGVEFVSVAREARVSAVAEGRIDVMCDANVPTIANRKLVSYSIPIFAGGAGAVVRADASTRLKDVLAGRDPAWQARWRANMDQVLPRRTFAVIGGTRTEQALAERIKDMRLDVRTTQVDGYAAGLARVVDGSVDVLFGERAILLDAVKRSARPADFDVIDRYFNREPLALVLPRGDDDFRLLVDAALSKAFLSADFEPAYVTYFGKPDSGTVAFFRAAALPN